LSEPATREQVIEMLQANRFYIKTVVDIRKRILAGEGAMHSDCETILLERDSRQEDIWSASWNPLARPIVYESMVNLRPRQNRSMQILSAPIREQVQLVIHNLLGAYEQLE
jgi:hypothetical protein